MPSNLSKIHKAMKTKHFKPVVGKLRPAVHMQPANVFMPPTKEYSVKRYINSCASLFITALLHLQNIHIIGKRAHY